MADLRIGTSGWSYPSGTGTWNGLFYPPGTGRRQPARGRRGGSREAFDELAYYAERFDTVEINSSFYGSPRAAVSQSWVDRTPAGFDFCLKLYQKFTHPGMYKASRLGDVPGSRDALDELARINQADIDLFRSGIEPLATAGKLGALLAQFPASFKRTPATTAYLDWLLQAFHDYPVAVELRHVSWSDAMPETTGLLNERGAAWVQIDEPKFRTSIRQNQLPNVRTFYYMRLHGRNAAEWWRHKTRDDRYNYLYSREELQPIAETAVAARALVRKAYLYLNNHFAAKAVVNAAMLKEMTGQPVDAPFPQAMVDRYPELTSIVTTAPVTVAWRLS